MDDDTATAGGRQRLLEAAGAELAELGLQGLSLRGIARRAGVSHAAPKYFFGDRAGMLTAVAADGFLGLAAALQDAVDAAGGRSLGVLGRAYVAYGLEHPALFDLMFRPGALHPGDAALQAAQAEALVLLSATVQGSTADASDAGVPDLALVSWAFVHGLVALVRDGALQVVVEGSASQPLLDRLITVFDAAVTG